MELNFEYYRERWRLFVLRLRNTLRWTYETRVVGDMTTDMTQPLRWTYETRVVGDMTTDMTQPLRWTY